MKKIGIIAALHEEIAILLDVMGDSAHKVTIGSRDYYQGNLYGTNCVVVLARIGKVAAAITTVTLIHEFSVDEVIFTGVAGSINKSVKVGDIVVADNLMQHDIDASPIFPRYEIPLLGISRFRAEPSINQQIINSALYFIDNKLVNTLDSNSIKKFNLSSPTVHTGTIISGDQFINSKSGVEHLREAIPDALCVEMEGAAVAQVCYEYEIPFAVFRTISDSADDSASLDFSSFLLNVARFYSIGIIKALLENKQSG